MIPPATDHGPLTTVSVEFYGIPRERAGVAVTTAEGVCLGDVLADLCARFPRFAESCVADNRLRPEYAANLNGAQFVKSPETKVGPGDALLILSADAGG
ncbi:MAG: MoaD/ThiS family protein [Planctomycetes bacterium]|nr:MoaD/ThiS family protein [Planctomycetota bacterium]